MGRILEMIKSFIEPAEEEKSFEELAMADGLGEKEIKELKKTMEGIDWKFDEEIEENKKSNKNLKKTQVNQITPKVSQRDAKKEEQELER